MSVTIRDIAEAMHIHPATVSSCLSDNYRSRRISEKLASEVRRKAGEMGYIPNRLAGRIFGRTRRKNIALIFKNDTAGSRSLPVLDHAIRFLGERKDCDFTVLYSGTGNLQEALKNGLGLGIRDFIVIGYMRGCDFAQCHLEKLPPVRIYACDYYFDGTDREFPSVVCKIGFNRESFYRKLQKAYEHAGLGPVKQAYALEAGQTRPEGDGVIAYEVSLIGNPFLFGSEVIAPLAERAVRNGECRTLLLRNDALAAGVVTELMSRGIRIPEDLAIVGFNDDPFSAYVRIPLTTVSLNLHDPLKDLLLNILEDRHLPPVIVISPCLVFRDSAPAVTLNS